MEDIGDYLYLIVILALGLFGALKKKKSRRTADQPEPSLSNSAIEKEDGEPMAAGFENEGVTAFTGINEPVSFEVRAKNENNIESPDLLEEKSLASEIASRFDLPEAIVYSEILNRKENF